jgi:hypothetical protein
MLDKTLLISRMDVPLLHGLPAVSTTYRDPRNPYIPFLPALLPLLEIPSSPQGFHCLCARHPLKPFLFYTNALERVRLPR